MDKCIFENKKSLGQHLPGFCPSMGVKFPDTGFDFSSVFIVRVSS